MTAASGAEQPTPATWDHRPLGGGLCVCGQPVHTAPGLRDQLADELARHQALLGPMDDARPDVWQARCECGWDGGDHAPDWKRRYRQHVADALLPLIEADRKRAVANALAARVLRDIDRSIEMRAAAEQP